MPKDTHIQNDCLFNYANWYSIDPEQIKRDIGLLPLQSTSSSSSFFNPPTAAEEAANAKSYISSVPSTESLLAGINDALGIDPVANQKIADEKEAAQSKQWVIEGEMKANGSMPICKEGQSPLSDWMALPKDLDNLPIIKETCMEEKKKMAAILIFPIEYTTNLT